MANVKKMTKTDRYNQLLAIEEVAENQDLVDFIQHEIDLIAKKAGSKKPSKRQEQNKGIKDLILAVLAENDKPMTVSAMMKANDALGELTNQKISALLRQLREADAVERTMDKKQALYSVK